MNMRRHQYNDGLFHITSRMDQLTSLLSTYESANTNSAPGTHIELEIRLTIGSLDEYRVLLSKISTLGTLLPISRSIAIIQDEPNSASHESKIATMMYKDTGLRVEKEGKLAYSSKRGLGAIKANDEYLPYKVAISAEASAPQFDERLFNRIRIKLRFSAIVPALPNWRMDFTLVIERTNTDNLVRFRESLFRPGLTPETFAEAAPFEEAKSLELELEWIGEASGPRPDSNAIYSALDYIRNVSGYKYSQNAEYQHTVFEIAKLLKSPEEAEKFRTKFGRKHLTPAPKGLNKKIWQEKIAPNITDFLVTIKADGQGVIGYVAGNRAKTIGGELHTVELKEAVSKPIIYEAELLADGRELIYDVHYIGGSLLFGHLPLKERIKRIPEVVTLLGSAKPVHAKEYVHLTTNYAAELKRLWQRKYDFPVDGIIFDSAYKWKPAEHLTIDLLVMRPPSAGVIGIPPHLAEPGHTLHFLFAGIERQQQPRYRIRNVAGYNAIFVGRTFYGYSPIQFAPPSKPFAYMYQLPDSQSSDSIHGHICEFKWDKEADRWALVRVRTDRDIEVARGSYFGNNIVVAFETWDNIQDPLTFEMLCGQEDNSPGPYFAKTDDRYKASNWFSSFAKEHSLKGIQDLSWVIDLAAGRGADLGRWGRSRIKNALCVDTDIDALAELQRRQSEAQRGLKHYKTVVYTHRADLRDDHTGLADTIEATFPLPKDGVPLIVCNMAIHYFCASDVSISNFVLLVDRLMAPGGHFIFTCLNGGRVFEQLIGRDRADLFVGNTLVYSIIRRYQEDAEFAEHGQMIEPMLACSGLKHVPEYLVNIPYVLSLFKGRGFELVRQVAFGSLLEEYSIDNLERYDKLSEADIENVSRYDYVIIRKKDDALPTRLAEAKAGGNSALTEARPTAAAIALAPEVDARFGSGILPTKKSMVTLTIPDGEDKPLADGRLRHIALPGLVKYTKLTVGDRITITNTIGASWDAVVEAVASYTTMPKLFASMPVSQFDLTRDEASFTTYWLALHNRTRLGKGGITVLTIRPIVDAKNMTR